MTPSDADEQVEQEAPATAEEPDTDAENAWKEACPEADQRESGTVTALHPMDIHERAAADSPKLGAIDAGTWVNLVASKGMWLCVDFPCDGSKLCPGWIRVLPTRP